MAWTKLDFSPKHIGKTLPQIVLSDPDWFFWSIETGVWKKRPFLAQEARMIDEKARNIRIPNNAANNLRIEYRLHGDYTIVGFEVVDINKPFYQGGHRQIGYNVIDFSIPRSIKGYDKLGYKLFIKSFKFWVFEDEDIRLTKAKCEAFFDDDSNFVLK